MRLGIVSLATGRDGQFIDVQRLNFRKFVKRPALSMVRCTLVVVIIVVVALAAAVLLLLLLLQPPPQRIESQSN